MIEISDKKNCCGCWSCVNACPKHCIVMEEDEEGFCYPEIDKDACVNCGICERVCPVINYSLPKQTAQFAYVVQNRNADILRESTSGGAFSAIAKRVLNQGGVVYGVALNNSLEAVHCCVDNEKDLARFRNSKYVQSIVGNSYQEAKRQLDEGKMVLFSGTPCQLEGLFQYLQNRNYNNLFTVDVVCRAVPSPLVLRKYLELQREILQSDIINVKFRDKYHGYKYSSLSLYNKDNNNYHEGIDTDVYLRAFFSGMSIRPSCTKCVFRSRYRRSDFTIWDCFNVEDFAPELDDDKGVTRVLCHSKRASDMMQSLTSDLKIISTDADKVVAGVKEMHYDPVLHPLRSCFFRDFSSIPSSEVFVKYFPLTLRHRLEKLARVWSHRLGIYKFMKKVFKSLHGKGEINR